MKKSERYRFHSEKLGRPEKVIIAIVLIFIVRILWLLVDYYLHK